MDYTGLHLNGCYLPRKHLERGHSLDVNPHDQRTWALQSIKEKASLRRKGLIINDAQVGSEDEKLISELEESQVHKLRDCESMSKKLRKLKKYRFMIREMQHRSEKGQLGREKDQKDQSVSPYEKGQ